MRASLLLIHDDSDLLDALTRVFEARGVEVAIAATGSAVLTRLTSEREFHAIVAGWDTAQGLGSFAYRWVLEHRYELRGQFVFLAQEPPDDFDEIVQGQCLLLHAYDFDEIVSVTEAAIDRAGDRAAAPRTRLAGHGRDRMDESMPSLLLIDDDSLQLDIMQALLGEVGFRVVAAESSKAAIAELEREDFDAILCDWHLASGSGGDIYEWLLVNRPHLASRCVFMSAAKPTAELVKRAPERPFVAKGQDSPALVSHLMSIVQEARTKLPRSAVA